MTEFLVPAFIFLCFSIVLFGGIWILIINPIRINQKCQQHSESDSCDINYVKPVFKELTAEQIADIHSRGKITPAEMVEEWEGFDLCAPGDAIGSAGWRCRKFKCCHDCLVDYANERDEYTSIFDIMEKNKYKLNADVDESELMIDMNKI